MVKAAPTEQPVSDLVKRHVERYRITTVDAVHRLFYAGKSRDAAKKALNRMVDADDLASVPIGKRTFYQIHGTAPLTSQPLWERFAVLTFCVMREPAQKRLTPQEFTELFPEFQNAPGISPAHQHYFLPLAGSPRLARALVDSDADADRVARKCRETLRDASNTPGLVQLLDARLFVIAVLFAEQAKADTVAAILREQKLGAVFQFHVIPELNDLLGLLPKTHGTHHQQDPA